MSFFIIYLVYLFFYRELRIPRNIRLSKKTKST